ncbi:hypothetical protein [Micromonospora chalcea]|uniref:hypothetical protein n=1 Tax=Micromonospora chalcea TaxID=1874 RepID=UPI003D74DE2A
MGQDEGAWGWPTVSGTGHRKHHLTPPQRLWTRRVLFDVMWKLWDQCNTRTVVSGFASGSDLWIADAGHRRGMTLSGHIPCLSQPEVWRDLEEIAEWHRLRALIAPGQEVVYGDEYHIDLLGQRNDGMLDVSDVVLAVWKRSKRSGGAAGQVKAARRRGLPIIHIDPEALTVRWPDLPTRTRVEQLSMFEELT